MTVINSASSLVNATPLKLDVALAQAPKTNTANTVQAVVTKSVNVTLSSQAQSISALQKNALTSSAAISLVIDKDANDLASMPDKDWPAKINVSGSASEVSAILDRLQTAGAKILKIKILPSEALSISASQLTSAAATLKKIDDTYTLNVSGVAAGKAASTAATKLVGAGTSLGTVASMSLSDTAAGLSAGNIAAVKTIISAGKVSISSITQTDSSTAKLSLTAQQMTDNSAVLAKLDSAAKITVSGVAFADKDTVLAKANVVSISVNATKAEVVANFGDLKTLIDAGRLTAITVTGTVTAFSMPAADIVANSSIFEKISGRFSLVATDVTLSASSLAAMGTKTAGALTGPIKVSGTAGDVSDAIDKLNVLGTKITELTVSDKSSNPIVLTATQLAASIATLNKIAGTYTLSVTDVLAANASQVATTPLSNKTNGSAGSVATLSVKDSAKNIGSALTALGALKTKINKMSQTDPATGSISLTGAQMTANAALFAKLDASVKLNVTSVAYADIQATLLKSNVASVGLAMSTTEVAANLADLKARIGSKQISAIALPSATNTLALSVNDVADNAAVLGKITSKFTLTLSSSTIAASQLSKLDAATLKLLPSTAKLTVTGSAADIKANMVALQALVVAKKIDKVALDIGSNISMGFADIKKYSATLAMIKGGKVTAEFSGAYNEYKVVQGAAGAFTITDGRSVAAAQKQSGTVSGVNFFKFSDITTFASSGDSNVDAVLNGGKNMWWYNGSGAASSSDPINGAFTTLASTSSKTKLTYSFLTPLTVDSSASASEKAMTEMDAVQKKAVKDAFGYLSSLVNVEFTDVSGQKDSNINDLTGKADINFGMNIQKNSAGYANPPHASGAHPSYLFLDSGAPTNNSFEEGTYGWETLVHEIGHAMGLKHPANVNAGGGGAPQPYLPKATDNRNFSIMSYNNASNTSDINITFTGNANGWGASYKTDVVNPSTFMTYDIAALQYLYGQNKDENIYKDLTVTFGADFKGIKTIYAPINGSMDASATTKNNVFDLRGGGYSTIGYSMQDQVTAQLKQQGATDGQITDVLNYKDLKLKPAIANGYNGQNTVGLAFGSHITSVTGGSAKDQFYVNGTDNVTIDGGAGDDTVYLTGSASDWSFVDSLTAISAAGGTISGAATLTNGKETVSLQRVEKYAFYNTDKTPMTHTA